jgi:hypothetical protein
VLLDYLRRSSRRDLFRAGGMLATLGLAPARARAAQVAYDLRHNIYTAIGVRPLINCKGHVHDHQRLADPARGQARHGRGLALLRAPG